MKVAAFLALAGSAAAATGRTCPGPAFYPGLDVSVTCDVQGCDARAATVGAFSVPASLGGFGWYDSTETKRDVNQANYDVLAARVTAFVTTPATVSMGYFGAQADFNGKISEGSYDGNANAGAFASAMANVYYSVLEFTDVDGDGAYIPAKDGAPVQEIFLATQSWDTLCLNTDDPKANLHVFNAQTVKTLLTPTFVDFSLTASMTDVPGSLNDKLLTPKDIKVDFQVKNFPYIGKNTKLAVSSIVAAAKAGAKASASADYSKGQLSTGDSLSDMTFSWDGSATVDGKDGVKVTANVDASASATVKLPGLAGTLIFAGNAQASADMDIKLIRFAIDAVQPALVQYDPMLTSGPPPARKADNTKLIIGASIGGAAALTLAIGGYCYFMRQKRKQQEGQEALLAATQV